MQRQESREDKERLEGREDLERLEGRKDLEKARAHELNMRGLEIQYEQARQVNFQENIFGSSLSSILSFSRLSKSLRRGRAQVTGMVYNTHEKIFLTLYEGEITPLTLYEGHITLLPF